MTNDVDKHGSEEKEEAKSLAEEHWLWLESLLHKVYVDAMIHGYKHGEQDMLERCLPR